MKHRPHGEWSGPRPFGGRDQLLAELAAELDRAVADGGRAIVLLGPAGSGKTACARISAEAAVRRHRGLRTAVVDCGAEPGTVWPRVARSLATRHRVKGSVLRLLPEWLGVVPVIGEVLSAIAVTITTIRHGPDNPRTNRIRRLRALDERYRKEGGPMAAVRAILEFEPREPRLIVLDAFERADRADLAGTATLLAKLGQTRSLVVLPVRTERGMAPANLREFILEAARHGRTRTLEIGPLAAEDIADVLLLATDSPAPEPYIAWAAAEVGGDPRELWAALGTLEARGAVRRRRRRVPWKWRWEWQPAPADLRMEALQPPARPLPDREVAAGGPIAGGPAVDDPLARETPAGEWDLPPDDVELLAHAAVEGHRFHSAVLAELLGEDELEIEDRLARLCRLRVIRAAAAADVDPDVSSVYDFAQPQDATAFAASLSADRRAALADQAGSAIARLRLPAPAGEP